MSGVPPRPPSYKALANSHVSLVVFSLLTESDSRVPAGLEIRDPEAWAGSKGVCHHALPNLPPQAGFHCLDQFGLTFVDLLP